MTAILITIINLVYYVLVILIFARVILSWVNIGSYQLQHLVWRLTEPLLCPVRRRLPATAGMDFSPFLVLLIAYFVRIVLIRLLL
jgi:YggT family protein